MIQVSIGIPQMPNKASEESGLSYNVNALD